MDRFLFVFGLIIFAFCLLFFVMNFFVGEYDGMALIWSLFGMLNASIAMGVAEILSLVKGNQK
ncbi:hypothetical protein IM538_13980 [Cytobacillus suaedae]|nr:hypothetical protein IM538_13980 [Cytobacillus suaedae]